jgi:hypothetical protein
MFWHPPLKKGVACSEAELCTHDDGVMPRTFDPEAGSAVHEVWQPCLSFLARTPLQALGVPRARKAGSGVLRILPLDRQEIWPPPALEEVRVSMILLLSFVVNHRVNKRDCLENGLGQECTE